MIYFRGMKNALQITVFLLLVSLTCKSQEYFIDNSGDTTFCDIISTTPLKVGYFKNGRIEYVNKNSIVKIFRNEPEPNESTQPNISKDLETFASRYDVKPRYNYSAQKEIIQAGRLLEKSRTLFYIGLACQVVGGGIMSLSALPTNSNPNTTLIIGGVVAGAGSIVSMSAFIPIGKAGIELQKVRLQ